MGLSYTIDEVRVATGLGRTRIYEAINNGQLQAKKYGKRTIILKSALEDFLNSLEDYPVKRPKSPP